MLAYTTVGTNNLPRARGFYDKLFAELGIKAIFERPDGRLVGYGTELGAPMFAVARPYDGGDASPGNGNMVAIQARDAAQVKALHDAAIALGATCDGPAGPRLGGMINCGYVRDLDGNKLNFFCLGEGGVTPLTHS